MSVSSSTAAGQPEEPDEVVDPVDDLDVENLRGVVEAGEMALQRLRGRERVGDRQVREVVLRAEADEQRLHLDVRVDADDGDVGRVRRPRLLAGVDLPRELVKRAEAPLAQEPPRLIEVLVAPLHHDVEHVLELRGAKLAATAVRLGPRLEVEDRVGPHVVDPRRGDLRVVALIGAACGIEELLEAVHIADAPRARLAVAAVGAALDVVAVAGHVPVADVDQVQRPAGSRPRAGGRRPRAGRSRTARSRSRRRACRPARSRRHEGRSRSCRAASAARSCRAGADGSPGSGTSRSGCTA